MVFQNSTITQTPLKKIAVDKPGASRQHKSQDCNSLFVTCSSMFIWSWYSVFVKCLITV